MAAALAASASSSPDRRRAARSSARPKCALVQPLPDRVERVHVEALAQARLVADQAPEPGPAARAPSGSENVVSSTRAFRVGCAPGTRRDAARRWSCRCRPSRRRAPDRRSRARRSSRCSGMQEDRPLVPRVLQRPLQLLDVADDAEAPLRVRVRERVNGRLRFRCRVTGSRLLEAMVVAPARSARLPPVASSSSASAASAGRWSGEIEQAVLVGPAHVGQPLGRHAVAQQLVVGERWRTAAGFGRRRLLRPRRTSGSTISSHRLPNLHELRGAGLRMRLQLAPLGPVVRLVVVIDVAQQQAARRPVDDQPDVAG